MNNRFGLFQLVLCNIRSYLREPEAIFWAYGFPLLMVIGLGIAFDTSSEDPVYFDVVKGPAAEEIRLSLSGQPVFRITVSTREEAFVRLRRNRTPLVVNLSEQGEVEYYFDPSNPEGRLARSSVDDALQRARGRQDALVSRDYRESGPGSRYVDFLVPGLIGMNLMGGGMWGVGFMLVDMRIKKLLKRLLGTPMGRPQFLISIVVTRIVFFLPEAFVLLLAAFLIFGVPVRGSLLLLAAIALLGAMTFAGLGLLAASRARRIETISGILNVVMMPMWLCSGIFFSSDRFPEVLQPVIQALPLTQLIQALRGVALEGQTLTELWTPVAVLLGWTSLAFYLALRWFRWH